MRFEVPVDGPPIWENYVKPVYSGQAGINQYYADSSAFETAYDDRVAYLFSHQFRASSAAYSDKGAQTETDHYQPKGLSS